MGNPKDEIRASGEEDGAGFVEAAISWDLFDAPARFAVTVYGSARAEAWDRLDASPVHIEMNRNLPRLPRTVWAPEPS